MEKRDFNPCVNVIVGAYWGDEGKGRVAFFESQDASLVLRTTGGNNAGHTVYYKGDRIPLHLIPSGIIWPKTTAIICSGVVVDPTILFEEIQLLSKYIEIIPYQKLIVSDCAHIIMPYHIDLDAIYEAKRGAQKIGTTGRGIGPCYADKANRIGIRFQDLLLKEHDLKEKLKIALDFHSAELHEADKLYSVEDLYNYCMTVKGNVGKYILNPDSSIIKALCYGSKVVIEGAQAEHLDLEHGDYPNCTSSYCNPSGTISAAGIGPKYVNKVIATIKAYCSRVGNGPFPTELTNEEGDLIREFGHEYGTTTNRPRRCGWLDLVAIYKNRGYTDLCLNHLDTIGLIGQKLGYIKVCTGYDYQGLVTYTYPSDIDITKQMPNPHYKVFEGGWEIPEGCKTFNDLPEKAKEFVNFIENYLKIPISYIGVGPNNEDTIVR